MAMKITSANFNEVVKESKVPVLIDFWAGSGKSIQSHEYSDIGGRKGWRSGKTKCRCTF